MRASRQLCQSVEYVVQWGIEHRQLGPIAAIGVDEIQYAKGHKYLTLVYQIDQHCTRLLWIGRERTVASFEQFFIKQGQTDHAKILRLPHLPPHGNRAVSRTWQAAGT